VSRSEARVFTAIWNDLEFTALAPATQRLYLFLLSQPDLSLAGLLPLRRKGWAHNTAEGLTETALKRDLDRLQDAGFVVVDEDTEELLVRSLVRRDRVLRAPKLIKPLTAAAGMIKSPRIRRVLLGELERARGEELEWTAAEAARGPVHAGKGIARIIDDVDLLIKSLYPQVDRVSGTLADGASQETGIGSRGKGKGEELTCTDVRSGRASRIPEDFSTTKWITPDLVAWAAERAPHVDHRLETEKFCNYWTSKAGKDACKLDWVATWRNWMLTAEERAPRFGGNGHVAAPVPTAERQSDSQRLAAKYAGQ